MIVEEYVRYSIVRLSKRADGSADYHGPKTLVYKIDLPRWLWLHRQRALTWISHRFSYFNPHDTLSTSLCFFDKKSGVDVGYKSAFQRLSSAKAQVTKMENTIADYVAKFKPTLFINSAEETDPYKRAIEKLNQKKAERFQAEQDLELEKQQLASAALPGT